MVFRIKFILKSFIKAYTKIESYLTSAILQSEKTKAINKNAVDDELNSEDYKKFLSNRSYIIHEMNRIQSKNHNKGSIELKKNKIIPIKN